MFTRYAKRMRPDALRQAAWQVHLCLVAGVGRSFMLATSSEKPIEPGPGLTTNPEAMS